MGTAFWPAVPWCWVPAHFGVHEIFIGLSAGAQACCHCVLHSSTDKWELYFGLQCLTVGSLHTVVSRKYSLVYLQWHKPVVIVLCTAALTNGKCILACTALQCLGVGSLHTWVYMKYSLVYLQWHKPVVTVLCTAAQTNGNCLFACTALQSVQKLFSDPKPGHCSTGVGKMHPHCPVLLCNAGMCQCKYTFEDLLYKSCSVTQNQGAAALVLAKCIPTAQCCSAMQACASANAPLKICCTKAVR